MMECWLKCKLDSHNPIHLQDNEAVIIGRSLQTKITDSKVSRQQVEIRADYLRKQIKLTQLGSNPCSVNGSPLKKTESILIKCDEEPCTLHIVNDQYPHVISFVERKDAGKKSHIKKTAISDFFKPKTEKNDSGFKQVSKRKLKDDNLESDRIKNKTPKEEQDLSESESDEETKRVREQLKAMQKEFERTEKGAYREKEPEKKKVKLSREEGTPVTKSTWEQHNSLLMYTCAGVKASSKVAGFDIDSTIICTQSGRVFPAHTGDWKIMLAETPGKLKQLNNEGYKILFFTNQAGIQRGKLKIPDFKQKIESILKKIGVPVQVFISTGPGPYRKPGMGMWNHLCEEANDGIEIDLDESFYVGDAAGRPVGWAPGKKKDFSCSDRLFALNIGVNFYTPEEYFLKHRKAQFNMPEFNPSQIQFKPLPENIASKTQEVIVMVGFPASGKSSFCKTHLLPKGYYCVNRDTLKTWQKCVEMLKKYLSQGKSVVVDNTNPDQESRKRYIDCARASGVQSRCFYMTTSLQHCRHNERFREMTDKSHQPINDMIMNSFKSKLTMPTEAEGFKEVLKIDFIPQFSKKQDELVYKKYLLDK